MIIPLDDETPMMEGHQVPIPLFFLFTLHYLANGVKAIENIAWHNRSF